MKKKGLSLVFILIPFIILGISNQTLIPSNLTLSKISNFNTNPIRGWYIDNIYGREYTTEWTAMNLEQFEYDQNGRLIYHDYLIPGYSNWMLSKVTSWTYNDAGLYNLSLTQHQYNGELQNESRSIPTYDSENKVMELLDQVWQNGWENYHKSIYEYDANGHVSADSLKWWNLNQWEDAQSKVYGYDEQGHQISYVMKDWINNTWNNSSRYSATYDGDLLSVEVFQYWGDTDWINQIKNIYTYNSSNTISHVNQFYYYQIPNQWVDNYQTIYTYDANNNLYDITEQLFENDTWNNYKNYQYYWVDLTSNNDPAISFLTELEITNYPNPFNPTTTISFDLPKAGLVNLDIYNIRGQKVKSLLNEHFTQGNHQVLWNGTDDNGSAVASGVYFARISIEGKATSRKLVLMK